jgi:hypothetical protein
LGNILPGRISCAGELEKEQTMKCYENRSRKSPIVAYELEENSITIKFIDGSVYLYTYDNAGNANVEQMKKYAGIGHGLNGFLSRFLKKGAGEMIQPGGNERPNNEGCSD